MGARTPASARAVALALADAVRARAEPEARAWFEDAFAQAEGDREGFLAALAAAGRRRGRAAFVAGAVAGEEPLADAGIAPPPEGWGLDEAARGALLLKRLASLAPAEQSTLAREVFYRGEVRERQALLRVLPHVPVPQGLLEIAREACRTSVESVFRAIACDNPYPAEHFDEPAFNQMVLKAVFVGAPVSRIVGLAGRATPEMRRMAEDYAAERRAAGRAVPEDVSLILNTR